MSSVPANKLRVLMVGGGYWGRIVLRVISSIADFEIVGLVDRNTDNTEEFLNKNVGKITGKSIADLPKSLEFDLVAICTGVSEHYKIASWALSKKRAHVFVEKPFTANTEHASELAALAKSLSLQIFVDHTLLFSDAYNKFKTQFRSRFKGESVFMRFNRRNFGDFPKDCAITEHLLYHDLYLLHDLVDLSSIQCSYFNEWQQLSPYQPDNVTCDFHGEKFRATLEASTTSAEKVRQISAVGESGILHWTEENGASTVRWISHVISRSLRSKAETMRNSPVLIHDPTASARETLLNEFEHIRDSLRSNNKGRVSPDDAIAILRTIGNIRVTKREDCRYGT